MFDKYLFALGRGVREIRRTISSDGQDKPSDPALAAKDVTPRADRTQNAGASRPLPRELLTFAGRALVMGIVNVTPDSFSDGGLYLDADKAIAHGARLVEERADILDVGGESTRPGSQPVDGDEELRRVLPVVQALAARFSLPISIDTMKARVASAAVAAGATIVNDVWGFQRDPDMARVVRETGVHCVLMHNREADDPGVDMFEEVRAFLSRSVEIALGAGIAQERVIVDPGIGFGKTPDQNIALIARLGELKRALGCRLLLGVSRKRFVGHAIGQPVAAERDAGSLAAAIAGVLDGADIIRAHNVGMHADALRMLAALRASEPHAITERSPPQ